MDVKLSLIHEFIPKIKFFHVDRLVTIMQDLIVNCTAIDGILVCNINAFQVASAILSIFNKLKQGFPLARLRILQYEEILIETMMDLLNNLYDPYKVSNIKYRSIQDKLGRNSRFELHKNA